MYMYTCIYISKYVYMHILADESQPVTIPEMSLPNVLQSIGFLAIAIEFFFV